MIPRGLVAIDACAGLAFAGGVALAARPVFKPTGTAAAYRFRILGTMIAAAALFLGGFATMAWVTA